MKALIAYSTSVTLTQPPKSERVVEVDRAHQAVVSSCSSKNTVFDFLGSIVKTENIFSKMALVFV